MRLFDFRCFKKSGKKLDETNKEKLVSETIIFKSKVIDIAQNRIGAQIGYFPNVVISPQVL